LPARDAQIQKLKEAEQISKRRKLVLPQAQVGEKELEEIVKIGMGGREARFVYFSNSARDNSLTPFIGPWWRRLEPAK
jgi:pre-mRNA-splicing factor CDC5/CEF1